MSEVRYSLLIQPAYSEELNGSVSYKMDPNAAPVGEMRFTNTYDPHVHEYTQKHDGTSHWDECSCGDVQNQEAHQYGEWTVTKEATETAKGEKQHTCSVCGYQETEEIAKLAKPGKTGDHSDLALWLTLLAVSAAGGVTGIVVYCKRRKNEQAK